MSIVWGIINLEGKRDKYLDTNFSVMKSVIDEYKVDFISSSSFESFKIGQGTQVIVNEFMDEKNILDKDGVIIVSDCIIDNRDELIEELSLGTKVSNSIIILEAYKKWGSEFAQYLLGDFTFVIIDKKNKKIVVGRDHCGHRSLYYYIDKNNNFIFSTTIEPIIATCKNDLSFNEEWIADFLINQYNPGKKILDKTIHNEIKIFPAASILTINMDKKLKFKRYWNPLEMERLKFDSYEECDDKFREILSKAVECRVQTNGEVGILLSGGLDSTSVGAFASKFLGDKGLKAFTSIPVEFYKNKESKSYMPDERHMVEKFINMYQNVEVNYCTGYGHVPLEIVDEVLAAEELPYAAIQNFCWLCEVAKKSSDKGCKVVLTGQFGNLSVSYGDLIGELLTLKKEKKYFSLYKQIKGVAKIVGTSKRASYKKIKKSLNSASFNKINLESTREEYETLNNEFLRIYLRNEEDLYKDIVEEFEVMRIKRFEDLMKTKIGSIDTVMGLKNGLVYRDPTKDKRIIEFTLRLTHEYFVREGKDRALIRESMKDLLPHEIVYNFKQRGYQSADWIQREERKLDYTKQKLQEILECDFVETYIDKQKVKTFIDDLNVENLKENSAQLLILIKVYILHRYYIKYGFDKKCNVNLDESLDVLV